jgi:glycosyltransferase involved in cell wall biosynthesis
MRIAFDAKRAFQNNTGLGNYSRSLIEALAKNYPEHEYYLAAPKQTDMFPIAGMNNVCAITPKGIWKPLSSLWRSKYVINDLNKLGVNVYHGLSNEIPSGINDTGIKSVVTIHDLIFERYPKQYKSVDVAIYRKKFSNACRYANKVIAISKQTKQDIMEFYKTPEHKIDVCYQSCNPIFESIVTEEEKKSIRAKYQLPEKYFLYVGSVIERKNLLLICKALLQLNSTIPLVVVGNGNSGYLQTVKSYIAENNLQNKVIFLSESPKAMSDKDFRSANDFPAIYQSAIAMIYPSVFEGFGIPILEALWSRLPVITSSVSCMPETGGDAAYYIDPYDADSLAKAMKQIATDDVLRNTMIEKGLLHARKFAPATCAEAVMKVYQSL